MDATRQVTLGIRIKRPAVKGWLCFLYDIGPRNGSTLVEALGRAGITDNCAEADTILRVLVEEGWIRPTVYAPSREQLFFGVGGRTPRRGKAPRWEDSYPQEWCFEANRDNEAFQSYTKHEGVL